MATQTDNPGAPSRHGGKDLTTGSIGGTLLLFALPTLGSSILQSLNGSINTIWVGRFLGEDALAATSNANLVMFLMFSAVFGFGMAATILIGQHMGRRDIDAARRVIGSAATLFAAISLVVAVLGWITAPALLRLLATPEPVFPLALSYLRVIFLGMPASFLAVLLSMGLRGSGDSLTPLWFMGLSVVIDVALNPVFILGLGPAPELGIAGSAVATLIASTVSLVALIAFIQWRDLTIRLRGPEWRYLRPDMAVLKSILSKGLPMGMQMIMLSISALAMIHLVNQHGVPTTAAYGVISQLWAYIQMPAMALGAAVSAMAAQNIGAGKWERVDSIAWSGSIINIALTGAMVVLITLVDKPLLGLFLTADSPSIGIAQHINLLVSWSFMLFGVSIVLSGVVRANGAVIAPLIILTISAIPVRLGIAYALEGRLGADAIWWSFSAGSVVSLVLTIGYYLRGTWRAYHLLGSDTPVVMPEGA